MNEPNASYETNLTLAKAIYEGLVAYQIDLGVDSPFYVKVPASMAQGSQAYSQTPFEQLPETVRNTLYDLALETIKKAQREVAQ